MTRPVPIATLRNLAEHQLKRLIERGIQVEDCHQVWRERWALEWPYRRRAANWEIVNDRKG